MICKSIHVTIENKRRIICLDLILNLRHDIVNKSRLLLNILRGDFADCRLTLDPIVQVVLGFDSDRCNIIFNEAVLLVLPFNHCANYFVGNLFLVHFLCGNSLVSNVLAIFSFGDDAISNLKARIIAVAKILKHDTFVPAFKF